MVNYEQLSRNRGSALLNSDARNKSIKLKNIDIINYPKVETSDEHGYCLKTSDGKCLYSQWKHFGKNMTDYAKFNDVEKRKQASYKFLSIKIGETSAPYIFMGITATTQMSNFSHEIEDVWVVSLKGTDPELPDEVKTWTFSSVNIYNQFKDNNIQEKDKIKIERQPKGDKSKYVVTKIS